MEALVFCLKALTEPGDTVAIESPIYFGIFNVIKILGLNVLEIPCHPEDGADLDYLENAQKTVPVKACLFVPNFSNPMGALMPEDSKKRLVEMLAGKDIPLIEECKSQCSRTLRARDPGKYQHRPRTDFQHRRPVHQLHPD